MVVDGSNQILLLIKLFQTECLDSDTVWRPSSNASVLDVLKYLGIELTFECFLGLSHSKEYLLLTIIGVSLSEPNTSMTSLHCVCVCLLAWTHHLKSLLALILVVLCHV